MCEKGDDVYLMEHRINYRNDNDKNKIV